MVRSTFVRTVVLLALCLALASPLTSAAAPHPGNGSARLGAPGVVDVLGWLKNAVAALWSKEGCQLDPWGRCIGAPATQAGCRLDPFGRCIDSMTTPTIKNGCQVDPFGRCIDGLTTAPTDNGCGLDPFGHCGG